MSKIDFNLDDGLNQVHTMTIKVKGQIINWTIQEAPYTHVQEFQRIVETGKIQSMVTMLDQYVAGEISLSDALNTPGVSISQANDLLKAVISITMDMDDEQIDSTLKQNPEPINHNVQANQPQ